MTRHAGGVGELTAQARSLLREIEQERLLAAARRDPLAPYRSKRRYPRFVVWELTLACNMRCAHCGSAAGKPRPDELRLDEMLRVCDELAGLGCERVTLLGGEPLVHPHWEPVAGRLHAGGVRANVITNGWTLASEELCDRLARAELSVVGLSIDGLEAGHDRLRRRPGSFARIARAVELLRERRVPVAVATVVTNDSLGDLDGLYRFLVGEKVRVWQLQIGNPLGRLGRDDPLLLAPERLVDLFELVGDKQGPQGGLRIDIADNVGYFGPYEALGLRGGFSAAGSCWTGCHAGIQAMGLDSNGDVKGCQSLPSIPELIEGNVRRRPLAEIWNAPGAFAYTREFTLGMLAGFCASCQWGPLCKAGCRSAALAHSGHLGDNPMCVHRVLAGRAAGTG